MNNYTPIQRFLHRSVLSSQFIREIIFDVEKSIFLKKDNNFYDNHVFIAGLARSGTTTLLNAIHQSKEFASLTYDDMPFILAPNFWDKVSLKKNHSVYKERAHGDGINISSKSPEAFEEVFWNTYPKGSQYCINNFINFVSLVLKKNNKSRYLSKNNQNIQRLNLISEIFPHSILLIPFREPLQQAFSLYSQHMKFIKIQNDDIFIRNYMNWIGHSEFGLDYKISHPFNLSFGNAMIFDHWLEQWYLSYKSLLKFHDKHEQIHLVCYESLCKKPEVWVNIKKLIGMNPEVKFSFKQTIKKIDQPFDKNLYDKCNEVYKSLVDYSI